MYHIQFSLFVNLELALMYSSTLRAYYTMFSVLDLSAIPDRLKNIGPKGYSIHAMIRALIFKHIEKIASVPRLIRCLESNPIMAELCGFKPGNIPHESRFYRLLKNIPSSMLEATFDSLNADLIRKGAVTLDTFILDSKPVLAATKENNTKNASRNLTDKGNKPERNPEATLGYFAKEPDGSKAFRWGYRTHVITSIEGVALVTATLPNNKSDAEIARTLIRKLKKKYRFKKGATFIADAAYDVNELYDYIMGRLKCQAVFSENPRNSQPPHTLGPKDKPLCDASLEMSFDGQWTDKQRQVIKHKYRCPLKTSRALARQYPQGCPVGCEKYVDYGCTRYTQESYSLRASVHRNTEQFQKTLDQRIVVEQYFSRMGDREAYQTTHYSLKVVQNQMLVAHISQSLVARAAVSLNRPEKMRCYQTFAQVS